MDLKETKRIEQLMNLFRGNETAHGIYLVTKSADPLKPKVQGRANTVPQCPTLKKWTEHYLGKTGLGIIPITDENLCYWGALDIDGEFNDKKELIHNWNCLNPDGTVNHIALQRDINKLQLPLVCCYSKSKSAHCFLFLEKAIPATAMRSILQEIASKLGVGGCEIFPKQDKLNKERGDLGNWLNMPYFGDTRKGVLLKDEILEEQDIDTFIEYALSKRLSAEEVDEMTKEMVADVTDLDKILVGAPPCLQHILKRGIAEGTRNKVLFNLAVYCNKRYGENFREEFHKLHDKYVDNPLSMKELETICLSAEKKEYQYQCKDPILKKYCNANLCMDRDCGIDFSSEIKSIKSATRILTDPIVYAVEIEMSAGLPSIVYVETDQLFSQDLFRKECSYQLKKTFAPITANAWNDIYVRLINTAVDQEPPYDMTEDGQWFKHLQSYIISRAQYKKQAMTEEEAVFHDIEKHIIMFRLDGFKTFLARKGIVSNNYSKWKLSQKLQALKIPTDDIDEETGKSMKIPIDIQEDRIKLGRAFVRVRTIPDKHLKLEQIESIENDEEIV